MRRLPPLNSLRAFEATARLASVSAAAEELRVSHSAVSQQLRQLENYFGQQLFTRPGRRVQPTPAALAYLEDIRAALDRISVSSERMQEDRAFRFISLNATPSFAYKWLLPRASQFQIANRSTQLRFKTSASDDIDQLESPYDFVFRRDAMRREGYVCRRILDDVSTPLMAPHFAQDWSIATPQDLLRAPLLHTQTRPNDWRAWFAAAGVTLPAAIGGSFLDNLYLGIDLAVRGVGAVIAPLILVEEELADGRLVAPFGEVRIERPGFHMLHQTSAMSEPGPRRFLRWLEEQTALEPADA